MSNNSTVIASPRPIGRYIGEAFALATVLTLLLLAGNYLTHQPTDWWEVGSVYFSFACTWLCTRQVRFNYVLGVVSTVFLVITFWQSKLYGSMALNLYLIPTVIYGWFIWGKDQETRPVRHVDLKGSIQYLLVTAVTWLGAYLLLTHFGGSMATMDGWLLVGSVLAQWMMDRKRLENWLVWALVNIVSIGVYWQAGLHLLALQFVLFLLNNGVAYREWLVALREHRATQEAGDLPSVAATPVVGDLL